MTGQSEEVASLTLQRQSLQPPGWDTELQKQVSINNPETDQFSDFVKSAVGNWETEAKEKSEKATVKPQSENNLETPNPQIVEGQIQRDGPLLEGGHVKEAGNAILHESLDT